MKSALPQRKRPGRGVEGAEAAGQAAPGTDPAAYWADLRQPLLPVPASLSVAVHGPAPGQNTDVLELDRRLRRLSQRAGRRGQPTPEPVSPWQIEAGGPTAPY